MADPARMPDPRTGEPVNADPVTGAPLNANPRTGAANTSEPYANRPVNVSQRSGGTGMIIAAVIVVLAIAAYFMFAPGTDPEVVPTEPAATTEPAAPAPDASTGRTRGSCRACS